MINRVSRLAPGLRASEWQYKSPESHGIPFQQRRPLFVGFAAFGDDIVTEYSGDVNDGLHDGLSALFVDHTIHEKSVDFYRLHRKLAQVGQRGISGTEIV